MKSVLCFYSAINVINRWSHYSATLVYVYKITVYIQLLAGLRDSTHLSVRINRAIYQMLLFPPQAVVVERC